MVRPGARPRGAGEDGKGAVAFALTLDEHAAVLLDRGGDQRVMARQGFSHRRGVPFPEASTALDVGEEKGDRAGRQLCHVAASA
jgi:hypothetical protein